MKRTTSAARLAAQLAATGLAAGESAQRLNDLGLQTLKSSPWTKDTVAARLGTVRSPRAQVRASRMKRPTAPRTAAVKAVTPAMLHPDVVVGALSEILQGIVSPVANTLADAGTYTGRPLAELFPDPQTLPEVTVTRRWRLPGLISEDLVFRSLHVPFEPKFRRRYREQYRETHLVYARRIRPRAARQRPRLLYLHG